MRARAGELTLTLGLTFALASCGSVSAAPAPLASTPPPPSAPTAAASSTSSASSAAAPHEDPHEAEARAKVREMLERVSKVRGLPSREEVKSRVLDRPAILERIRARVEKEVPREAVQTEGEFLAALELIPPDYDFVEGSYALLQGRIAGFYEPDDKTMYLVSDLTDAEATETLAHELDHALQDQAFDIGRLLKYVPGESDKSAAAHAILEGDATAAMFDVSLGSAFKVSPALLRKLIANAPNAPASPSTPPIPHVLEASLTAPYTDGFAFVQHLREASGWPAVDLAIRSLPDTTEQLLHPDKLASREPAIAVAAPTLRALGAGYRVVVDDVTGEQSLRLMLEEWVPSAMAEAGAAGWGGDRYVVVRKGDGSAGAVALGWHIVMDTVRDAVELAEILEHRFGRAPCKERRDLGPLAIRRKKRDLAIVAGPYTRQGKVPHASGDCRLARAWLNEILP